jgi:hypothetical protein
MSGGRPSDGKWSMALRRPSAAICGTVIWFRVERAHRVHADSIVHCALYPRAASTTPNLFFYRHVSSPTVFIMHKKPEILNAKYLH